MKARWLVVVALWSGVTLAANNKHAHAQNNEEAGTLPEVVITPGPTDIVEEYRINGLRYMIKVTPKKGVPYYLVDSDGDGVFETRQNELSPDMLIPRWVLFKF